MQYQRFSLVPSATASASKQVASVEANQECSSSGIEEKLSAMSKGGVEIRVNVPGKGVEVSELAQLQTAQV